MFLQFLVADNREEKKMGFIFLVVVLVFFQGFLISPISCLLNSDGLSLLALKASISTDPYHTLKSWLESDETPCKWYGITCNIQNRVTQVYLPNKGFNGYIPSELGALTSLQNLSLSTNNFTNIIPPRLFNATSLVSLDLSHNSFSGTINPNDIKTLTLLSHLDLSSNLLNGSLPDSLTLLPQISGTLNLSYNRFSGEVPSSYGEFPVTVSLDLRHNNLSGKIPQVGSLLNQGPTAFSGNPNLCGFPLSIQCPEAAGEDPRVPLNPNQNPNPNFSSTGSNISGKSRGISATVPIISAISVLLGVFSISVWLLRKKCVKVEGKMGKEKCDKGEEEEEDEEGQKGKFVVIDEGFSLELEDLLRASAYVVGKSRSGIVYKVVAGRLSGVTGVVVAVRRLSEGGGFWRFKEFISEVEMIGKIKHPNVVRLRAYYFASDEKLLVSDFISNGSLYSALHGGPSSSLPPLSWSARLKIIQGSARGLAYIHECSPRKYVHGNIKSSKILLDEDLHPYISGFGLTRLISSTNKTADLNAEKNNLAQKVVVSGFGSKSLSSPTSVYLAPEAQVSSSKMSQKCDVYSFGVAVLETLTGRLPDVGPENDEKGLESFVRRAFQEERPLSEIIDPALIHEVYAKKQVLAAFHIALSCTELDPEIRPRMRSVSESLDRIGSPH
ncbi:receptor protein kinase-like protein ZAR1 [Papaver somniferum]|nr:receptor protein kinase-like protein ZAR1 [Papaver somniferum]